MDPLTYQDRVHVHAIHLQPLGLVQVVHLGLGWSKTDQGLVLFQNGYFDLLRLIGHESELGHSGRRMDRGVIVAQFS